MSCTFVFSPSIRPIAHRRETKFFLVSLTIVCRGVLGFTNADPEVFVKQFDRFPANDPAALVDRNEFWILQEKPFDEKLTELDEYRLRFDRSGEIRLSRNNLDERTVIHTDPSVKFYPFLFLNGRVNALSLFGSSTKVIEPPQPADEDSDLCGICYINKANCVLLPCGHIFFCFPCKTVYERTSPSRCPKCREPFKNTLEIEVD